MCITENTPCCLLDAIQLLYFKIISSRSKIFLKQFRTFGFKSNEGYELCTASILICVYLEHRVGPK